MDSRKNLDYQLTMSSSGRYSVRICRTNEGSHSGGSECPPYSRLSRGKKAHNQIPRKILYSTLSRDKNENSLVRKLSS
jgi:hypothetical protein